MTAHSLRFLLSPRSLAGLLAANLITLVPFLAGALYMPYFDSGLDVGAGVIQPLTADFFWGIAQFGVIASLSGTIILAVPVICHLHARGKSDYTDYVSALMWLVFGLSLLTSIVVALATMELGAAMGFFMVFPIIWLPAWMACATYWVVAVKQPHHKIKIFSLVMFVLAFLIWCLLSINLGAFIATD